VKTPGNRVRHNSLGNDWSSYNNNNDSNNNNSNNHVVDQIINLRGYHP